jgi:hypothetical protein
MDAILAPFLVSEEYQPGVWMHQNVIEIVKANDLLLHDIGSAAETFFKKTRITIAGVEPFLTSRERKNGVGVIEFEIGVTLQLGDAANGGDLERMPVETYGFCAFPAQLAVEATTAKVQKACAKCMQAVNVALNQFTSVTGHVPAHIGVQYLNGKTVVTLLQTQTLEEAPVTPLQDEVQASLALPNLSIR